MKLRHFLFLSLCIIFSINSFSQNDSIVFKPSGRVFGTSFLDYSSGLNSSNNTSGFDITRALLGYKYKFTQNLEATISIDGAAGKSTNDKLEVHVRNAFVSWSNQGFKLDVGLITLKQFSLQQKMWGHRYALQSQQDLAGMGHSVDLGAQASYTFSPLFSIDLGFTNGEGYKKIRKDKSMRYSLGATTKPLENFVFRVYGDIYSTDKDKYAELNIDKKMMNQFSYSAYIGYQNENIVAGLEYNKQLHNQYIRGNHIDGVSVFSTYFINSKWNVYARYDYYGSSSYGEHSSWYDDRHLIVAGVEFKPFNILRLTPNFRNINYTGRASEQFVFMNAEINF